MSDFFQIKIKNDEYGKKTKEQMESLGLSTDHWVIRNAMWCEDYFDLDHEDIANHVAMRTVDDWATLLINDNPGNDDLVDPGTTWLSATSARFRRSYVKGIAIRVTS